MDYTYDYFLAAFEEAKNTARKLVTYLDDDVFITRPAEGKWCIGEILSHLVQAGNEYLLQIKKGMDRPDDKIAKGTGPFSPNFLFRWFIRQVSPANKRPLPTVKQFYPQEAEHLNRENVLADFLTLQDKFISILREAQAKQLDLEGIKTNNPIVKFVPMSLAACFGVIEAHQRRHFEQMSELKERFTT